MRRLLAAGHTGPTRLIIRCCIWRLPTVFSRAPANPRPVNDRTTVLHQSSACPQLHWCPFGPLLVPPQIHLTKEPLVEEYSVAAQVGCCCCCCCFCCTGGLLLLLLLRRWAAVAVVVAAQGGCCCCCYAGGPALISSHWVGAAGGAG